MTYKEAIINRIEQFSHRDVFISNDFLDIADYETVRSTLNRLVNSGDIRRIINGIYYKPKFISIINDYSAPSMDEVANAIARKHNWTIAPSGNTSLNMLGLCNQVPAQWNYVSDGRYVKFNITKNITIEFKRCNNGDLTKMSKIAAIVIQAIKALGKDKVTEQHINSIRKLLSNEDKLELLDKGKTTSAWVYRVIKKICLD